MDNIRVSIRVRPLNERERNAGQSSAWQVLPDGRTIIANSFQLPSGSSASTSSSLISTVQNAVPSAQLPLQSASYTFDHIFNEESSTKNVYDAVVRDLIQSALDGINATVFAYGQTSSGKTFTLQGCPNESGVLSLAVDHIFQSIQQNPDSEYLLRVSYLELYNEVITDLLNPGNRNLKIHETVNREIFVGNLTEEIVMSAQDVIRVFQKGEGHRHVGETAMNERSSRSHTIFRMVIESRSRATTEPAETAVKVSWLNIVDLAGSERVGHTGAEGLRLREGGHINKSLLALGSVIARLSEGNDQSHIPYRDSKLTRILQPSLGGNARTLIICTITPATGFIDETHGTLKFATRAKQIRNAPEVNEIVSDETLLRRYRKEIDRLKKQLDQVKTERAMTSTPDVSTPLPPDTNEEEKRQLQKKLDMLRKVILNSPSQPLVQSKKQRTLRRQTWFAGVDASEMLKEEKELVPFLLARPEEGENPRRLSEASTIADFTERSGKRSRRESGVSEQSVSAVLEEENARLQNTLASLKTALIDLYVHEIRPFRDTIQFNHLNVKCQLQDVRVVLQKRIEELEEREQHLALEWQTSTAACHELEQKCHFQQQQLEAEKIHVMEWQQKYHQLVQEGQNMAEEHFAMQHEKEKMKRKIEQLSMALENAKNAEVEASSGWLEEKNDLILEMDAIKSQLKEQEKNQSNIIENEAILLENGQLKQQLESSIKEKDEIFGLLKEMDSALKLMEQEKDALKQKLESVVNEKEMILNERVDNSKFVSEKDELMKNLASVTEERDAALSRLSKFSSEENSSSMEQVKQFETHIQSLTQELKSTKAQLTEYQSCSSQLVESQQTIEKLMFLLSEQEKENSQLLKDFEQKEKNHMSQLEQDWSQREKKYADEKCKLERENELQIQELKTALEKALNELKQSKYQTNRIDESQLKSLQQRHSEQETLWQNKMQEQMKLNLSLQQELEQLKHGLSLQSVNTKESVEWQQKYEIAEKKIKDLQFQIDNSLPALQQYKQKIQILKEERDSLADKATADAQLNEEKLEHLTKELNEAAQKLKQLQIPSAEMSGLKSTIQELNASKEKLEQENQNLSSQCQLLQAKINSITDQRDQLAQENKSIHLAHESTLANHQSIVKKLEERIQELKEECQNLCDTHLELQAKLSCQNEDSEWRKKLKQCQSDYDRVMEECYAYRVEVSDKCQKLRDVKKELTKVQEQYDIICYEKDELSAQLAEKCVEELRLKEEFEGLRQEKTCINNNFMELNQDFLKLNEILAEKTQELSNLSEEHSAIILELSQVKKVNLEMTQEKIDLAQINQQLSQANQELLKEKEELAKANWTLTSGNQEFEKVYDELEEKKQDFTKVTLECKELKENWSKINQELSEVKLALTEKSQELSMKVQDWTTVQLQLTAAQEQIEQSNKSYETTKDSNQQLTEQLTQSLDKNNILQQKMSETLSQLKLVESKCTLLESDLTECRKLINSSESLQMQMQYEMEINNQKATNEMLLEENKSQQHEWQMKYAQLQSQQAAILEQERQSLTEKLHQSFTEKWHQTQESYKEKDVILQSLEQEKLLLQRELQSLKEQLTLKSTQLYQQESLIQEKETLIEKYQKEKKMGLEMLDQLEKECERASLKVKECQAQLNEKEKFFVELQSINSSLEQRLALINQELKHRELKCETLFSEKETLSQQCKSFTNQNYSLSNQCENLLSELNSLKSQLKTLEQQALLSSTAQEKEYSMKLKQLQQELELSLQQNSRLLQLEAECHQWKSQLEDLQLQNNTLKQLRQEESVKYKQLAAQVQQQNENQMPLQNVPVLPAVKPRVEPGGRLRQLRQQKQNSQEQTQDNNSECNQQ